MPLRWVVILLIAGTAATVAAVAPGGGLIAALTIGIGTLGVLPLVIAKR